MEPYETHLALGTALAIALLVGLLVGLSTLLAAVSPWLPLVSLLGVVALVTVSYAADIRHDADHGMTTEASVIGVYDGSASEVVLQNPFELGAAVKVSLMFGVVLLVTKAATVYLGPEGLHLASALSGTTDVDAVTLSTARLAREGITHQGVTDVVATLAITLAIATITVVKTALASSIGGRALGRRMAVVGGLVLAGGAAGLVATRFIA